MNTGYLFTFSVIFLQIKKLSIIIVFQTCTSISSSYTKMNQLRVPNRRLGNHAKEKQSYRYKGIRIDINL